MYARHRYFLIGFAALLGLSAPAADAQADHLAVSSGTDAAATFTGVVRYRNFGNSGSTGGVEVQVGDGVTTADPPTVTNAESAHRTWAAGDTALEISYTAGVLKTVVGGTTVQKSVSAPFNYLQITVRKNQSGMANTTVSLNNLSLDGHSLGNRGMTGMSSGIVHWNVTGIDLSSGFTLTGTLNLSSPVTAINPGDSSFAQIAVGSVPSTDADAPVVSDIDVEPKPVILYGEATVRANVDDTGKGDSDIDSADYSLDGGAWTSMDASDGAFDSVSEDVEATFIADEVGTREVCVQGTDEHGNTSSGDDCTEFLVTYDFEGFFSPVENSPIRNSAKAGQAIPIKWRLTDADDLPIEDLSSFAGLFSYEVGCTTLSGNPADAVEEYASGSSGIQYNGDGYFQFNWKTEKAYATKCRALYVLFDSGAGSPAAFFEFKK